MNIRFTLSVFLLLILFTGICAAQKVQHAIGLGYFAHGPQPQKFIYEPFDRAPYEVTTGIRYEPAIALTYCPIFGLKQFTDQNMGLALSFPLTISAFAQVAVVNGQTIRNEDNYLLLSLPATMEFGIGERAFAQATNKHKLGAFVGLGGSFTLGSGAVGKFSQLSPHGTIGIRKGFGKIVFQLAYGRNFVGYYKPDAPLSYLQVTTNDEGAEFIRATREREPRQTHSLYLTILLK